MDFEYLSNKEFEELTEKQQARYLKEKRDYEKTQSEKAVKDAVEAMRKDLAKEQEELVSKLNDEQKEAIKEATEKQAKE